MRKKIFFLLIVCILSSKLQLFSYDTNLINDDCQVDESIKTPSGKLFLGEEEFFYIKQANAEISARIDTGAGQSSISARNIIEFERDGKKFVKFDFEANDKILTIEAPFVREVDIRQVSSEEVQWRKSVKLSYSIGDYSSTDEFSLVDRKKMNYPLLIGRNILKNMAIVDVSRKYIQGLNTKDCILILSRDNYNENLENLNSKNEKTLAEKKKETAKKSKIQFKSLGK